MRARLAPLAALALALPVPALAAPTCTATPQTWASGLEGCLQRVDPGGTIFLPPGEHWSRGLTIDKPVTLEGTGEGVVVSWRGSLLLEVLKTIFNAGNTYLVDGVALFDIESPGGTVRLDGLELRPATWIDGTEGTIVVGRGIQAFDAEVELHDVSLMPWDTDGDGATSDEVVRLWPRDTTEPAADRSGGVLIQAGARSTVRLEDITVTGVVGRQVTGAAVHVSGAGSSVSLVGASRLEDVTALAGAVHVTDGAELVVSSTADGAPSLQQLSAAFGSAVLLDQRASGRIEAGLFSDSAFTDEGSTVSRTTSVGGLVALDGGASVVVTGGTFRGSTARVGGAIGAQDSDVTITGGSFEANTARQGGHVAVFADTGEGSLSISGGRFIGGVAELVRWETQVNDEAGEDVHTSAGGALFAAGVPVTITGGEIRDSGSARTTWGGLLALIGSPTELRDVSLAGGLARIGGAVLALESDLTLTDVRVTGSGDRFDTAYGGALAVFEGSLVADGLQVTGSAAVNGGAVACQGVSLTCRLRESTLSGNDADRGGALWGFTDKLWLEQTDLTDNAATTDGGAVHAVSGTTDGGERIDGSLWLEGGTVTGNTGTFGGGLYLVGVETDVLGARFADNAATEAGGGALHRDGVARVQGSTFVDNLAGTDGAGWFGFRADTAVVDTRFQGNAAQRGAGLGLAGLGEWSVGRSVFCANEGNDGADLLAMGPETGPGTGDLWVTNSLFDGGPEVRDVSRVFIARKRAEVAWSNVVRWGADGLFLGDAAEVDVHHTFLGYSAGDAAIHVSDTATVTLADNAYWDDGLLGRPVAGAAPPTDREVLDDPRLRGPVEGEGLDGACVLADHHPRPDSPLLLDGYPLGLGDPHIGIFGGEETFVRPWEDDVDVDGVPAIFDCDDDDDLLGDRLVQYVDADGDGVGAAEAEGFPCALLPGHSLTPGDCDDADPDRTEDCTGAIAFYGSTCATAPTGWPVLALPLLLLGLRRRR